MDINLFRGISTVLALLGFLAVVFWAYSGKRKQRFDNAATSLFSEEEEQLHKKSLEEMKS